MKHTCVRHDALNFFVQYTPCLLVAGTQLDLHGRKFTAHLLAKLQKLRFESIHPGGQFFEKGHALFEPFYPSFKRLRLHAASCSGADSRPRTGSERRMLASRMPTADDDGIIVIDCVQCVAMLWRSNRESREGEQRDVVARPAVEREIGEDLADDAAELEPVAGKAGGDADIPQAGRAIDDEVLVG